MISAPSEYDAYTDVRKIEFEIKFGITPPEALENLKISATETLKASNLKQIIDNKQKTTQSYTTLEKNIWILNGEKKIYPSDTKNMQTGFISESLSDNAGSFTTPPNILFEFAEPQDLYGITLFFDDKTPYAWSDISTIFYDAENKKIYEASTAADAPECYVNAAVKQCKKFTVDAIKTALPHRRTRITEIIFGTVEKYDKHSIESATETQEIDFTSERLPASELTITVDNSDGIYDLINPVGAYAFLQSGQYAEYMYRINGVEIKRGKKYFAKADSDGLTATITFQDETLFLDTVYNGGSQGTWTLEEAAETLLLAAGVGVELYFDGSIIKKRIIRKCIPQETTVRDALTMCAQAARCSVYIDTQSRLHFMDMALKTAENMTRERMSEEPAISVNEKYDRIVLRVPEPYSEEEERTYTKDSGDAEEVKITKEYSNPLVEYPVAWLDWIYGIVQKRTTASVSYRGDPVIECGDTVKIYDKFDTRPVGNVESIKLIYDGGLEGELEVKI